VLRSRGRRFMTDMLVLRGEEQNLRLLSKEIAGHPELAGVYGTRITTADDATADSLGYGPVVELVISLTTGVATNAAYDLLRSLISRARDRGELTEQQKSAPQQDEDGVGEEAKDGEVQQ
jgi:hypothetical protein